VKSSLYIHSTLVLTSLTFHKPTLCCLSVEFYSITKHPPLGALSFLLTRAYKTLRNSQGEWLGIHNETSLVLVAIHTMKKIMDMVTLHQAYEQIA
jgi:hypothetical protein